MISADIWSSGPAARPEMFFVGGAKIKPGGQGVAYENAYQIGNRKYSTKIQFTILLKH